jgi:hypothetical protein
VEEPIQMTDAPDIVQNPIEEVNDYDYRTPTERNLNDEKSDDRN